MVRDEPAPGQDMVTNAEFVRRARPWRSRVERGGERGSQGRSKGKGCGKRGRGAHEEVG